MTDTTRGSHDGEDMNTGYLAERCCKPAGNLAIRLGLSLSLCENVPVDVYELALLSVNGNLSDLRV